MERIAFTPAWLVPAKDAAPAQGAKPPVIWLRAASVLDRDMFEAELEGAHRAGLVLSFHLLEAAERGLQALLGDDATPLIELVRSDVGGEDLPPTERAQVKTATDLLAQHWPDYRALVEQEARRNALLPTLAFLRWCDGWDELRDDKGEPIEYRRDPLGALDVAAQRRIPFAIMRSAGLEAYRLQYGQAQAKN